MSKIGIIGDTHSPVMIDGYAEWCMDVFSQWDVERIIHIGDLADFHAASFHDSEVGFCDVVSEMEEARIQIQHMQEVFGADVTVLTGNHDANLKRKVKAIGLDPDILKSPEEIWGCKLGLYASVLKASDRRCDLHARRPRQGRQDSCTR